MNPIPISWCAIGGAVLMAVGAWGGWTVATWRADAELLKGIKEATKQVADQTKILSNAADTYQRNQQNGQVATNTRESTIREIYRNTPAVPVNCAAPVSVRGVLEQAVSAANARAAGQPQGGLPAAAGAASSAD